MVSVPARITRSELERAVTPSRPQVGRVLHSKAASVFCFVLSATKKLTIHIFQSVKIKFLKGEYFKKMTLLLVSFYG